MQERSSPRSWEHVLIIGDARNRCIMKIPSDRIGVAGSFILKINKKILRKKKYFEKSLRILISRTEKYRKKQKRGGRVHEQYV